MKKFYFSALGLCMALSLFAQRNELSLEKGWKFTMQRYNINLKNTRK